MGFRGLSRNRTGLRGFVPTRYCKCTSERVIKVAKQSASLVWGFYFQRRKKGKCPTRCVSQSVELTRNDCVFSTWVGCG